VLAAGLLTAALAGAGRAQDDKGGPPDRKMLDGTIYVSLRDVINRGADLYNAGDWAGCYRLYEGALMAVRPLLDHRPGLQKAIETGLANAERDPAVFRRAFVLREVLNTVRNDVNPNPTAKAGPRASGEQPAGKTLWDRLGGEKGVGQVIDDVVAAAAPDPKVDFFRGGKYKLDAAGAARLKKVLIEQVSSLTGGPYKYTGRDMREVHKGMGITDAQFDAFMGHVRDALEKNKVKPDDAATVLAAFQSFRKDVVEAGKPEGKPPKTEPKPEDKAPATVTGTVTFLGQPVKAGTITLHGGGKRFASPVNADGTYEVKGPPAGEYAVTVEATAVPKKYADPKTSGLTYKVNTGPQVLDVELK
jgi:truncated hemoglobin YjbI